MGTIRDSLMATSDKHSSVFTQGSLALPPAKKYLVLTCMDARIDPAQAFGISLGDAHVIRNVCLTTILDESALTVPGRSKRSRCIEIDHHFGAAVRHNRNTPCQAHRLWNTDLQELGCVCYR